MSDVNKGNVGKSGVKTMVMLQGKDTWRTGFQEEEMLSEEDLLEASCEENKDVVWVGTVKEDIQNQEQTIQRLFKKLEHS